ncbi:MAG: hypothetical protein R3E53_11990 [Myxococcota bacterium]
MRGARLPEESGIPYETALIRNHYVSRSFIEPTQTIRDFKVRVKTTRSAAFSKASASCSWTTRSCGDDAPQDRRDASRGGRRECARPHLVSADDRPAHYGIDTPNREELIAHVHTVEEIRPADRRRHPRLPLSVEGLRMTAAKELKRGICDACFLRT